MKITPTLAVEGEGIMSPYPDAFPVKGKGIMAPHPDASTAKGRHFYINPKP